MKGISPINTVHDLKEKRIKKNATRKLYFDLLFSPGVWVLGAGSGRESEVREFSGVFDEGNFDG